MSRIPEEGRARCLVMFTKPPRPGRVKTRLIGDLTAEQAAELHGAFLGDLLERLSGGNFELRVAWALEDGEAPPWAVPPWSEIPGEPQQGRNLGERLLAGLSSVAEGHALVAAVGSDLPTLDAERVEQAFRCLEGGADVVLGPVADGGYYLVALPASGLYGELFSGISWSTERVLAETLERCRNLELRVELLPQERDVDTPADLVALAEDLVQAPERCPRTRALLVEWGRLPASPALAGVA